MPIYEFICNHCKSQWEILVLGTEKHKTKYCPKCAKELKKIMSSFANPKGGISTQSCSSTTGFS